MYVLALKPYKKYITELYVISFIYTHSLVISPLGPVGVANFGSIPWVSRICLAAGLRRNLGKQASKNEEQY